MPEFGEEETYQPRQTPDYEFVQLGDDSAKTTLTLEQAEKAGRVIVEKAEAEAEAMTAGAREEAERMRQEAEAILREAEEIRSQAREEGYGDGQAKGLAQGREDGFTKFEQDVAPLFKAFENIDRLYEDLWTSNEAPMIKLATTIANRVVLKEISMSPETVGAAFKAVIDMLQEQHEVVFSVNPEDLAYLEALRGELRDRLSGLTRIEFKADENLTRGDLIMETEAGRVDATVKRRMEAVIGAVDETLETAFDLDW
jgi:flagellar biosynthesis/type III secretory pathway protein FliH